MRRTSRFAAIMVIGAAAALAACGGHKPPAAAPSGGGGEAGGGEVAGGDESGGESANPCGDNGMCPPETLDRINQTLDAKSLTMSRCLDLDGVSKNAHGKVTLSFVITTSGKATNVKVAESTIHNETVERCVVEHLQQVTFPEVPKDLDWSHTYAFEAN